MLRDLMKRLRGEPATEATSALDADALLAEGAALWKAGKATEAEGLLRRAVAAAPGNAPAHIQLGIVLASTGRLDEAEELLARAVSLAPGDAFAQMNLANAYRRRGATDRALEHYRAAVRLRPELHAAWSNLLRPMLDACDWTGAEAGLSRILALRKHGDAQWARYIAPMDSLLLPLPGAQVREVAEFHAARIEANAAPVRIVDRPPRGRLRIAYLSRDFRNHAVGQLARSLFRAHDRGRFEVLAYSYGRDDESPYRRDIVAPADAFVDVRAEPPEETALRIARDAVDILVDLGGYTTDDRLSILARRPAPVQVHYLGYPGTLGARFVDYFVTDGVASPPGQDALFTERLARLPACFMVSDPDQPLADPPVSRAHFGLPAQAAVFCAFHQTAKITREVFDAWCEILRAVPESVLWLRASGDAAERNLVAAASEHGIDPGRLVFAPNVADKRDHVGRMAAATLFLDTFGRYNGHSTVNEALWARLPVVTLAGELFAARVAASLVAAAGVPELAVATREDYVAAAVRLAGDEAEREKLRARLEAARMSAPLFDTARTVRSLERAYETMWEIRASGGAPRAFTVAG